MSGTASSRVTTPRVVGLDLSLTSSGLSDGTTTFAVQTSPRDALEPRIDHILRSIMTFLLSGNPSGTDLVVMEGAAGYGSGVGVEALAGLRVAVRHKLWRSKIPFAVVPPATLKRYTTGYGGADKEAMIRAVILRHHLDLTGVSMRAGRTDMADAFALAAMGYDHVGHPIPSDPEADAPERSSLDAIQWPALVLDE